MKNRYLILSAVLACATGCFGKTTSPAAKSTVDDDADDVDDTGDEESELPPIESVYQVTATSSVTTFYDYTCIPITFTAKNLAGTTVRSDADIALAVTDNAGYSVDYFTDSACTHSLAGQAFVLAAEESAYTAYFFTPMIATGTFSITTAQANVALHNPLSVAMNPRPVTMVTVDFLSHNLTAGECGQVRMAAFANGGYETAPSFTSNTTYSSISVTTGNGGFYTNAGCTTPQGPWTINASTTEKLMYLKVNSGATPGDAFDYQFTNVATSELYQEGTSVN